MAMPFTAWLTHVAPMGSSIGASPPWHTSTIDPASLLGAVVDDTFSVRSPCCSGYNFILMKANFEQKPRDHFIGSIQLIGQRGALERYVVDCIRQLHTPPTARRAGDVVHRLPLPVRHAVRRAGVARLVVTVAAGSLFRFSF
jgi:hypothetical protein